MAYGVETGRMPASWPHSDASQVDAAGLEEMDERWARYDPAFARAVGQVDGATLVTGVRLR
jgi:hypothetical protein